MLLWPTAYQDFHFCLLGFQSRIRNCIVTRIQRAPTEQILSAESRIIEESIKNFSTELASSYDLNVHLILG